MADIIRITASQVGEVATRFTAAAEETETLLSALSSEVENMSSGWEGDAYTAFSTSFADLSKQLQNVAEMYRGITQQLNQVVEVIQNTDAELASAMKNQG